MSAPALTQYALGGAAVTADGLNTFEQTCDTFQQLRGLIGTAGMQVFARGRSYANDGQGGAFYWNPTSTLADNNNNVLQPTGGGTAGRWIQVNFSTPVNASSVPTSGTWVLGDIVYNSNPVGGGYIGWVCVTAGTPGTWKTFGAISA